MYSIKIIYSAIIILALFSCCNKTIAENNYKQALSQQNIHKVAMIHPIEYYKNEITKYEDNYYGFRDVSMEITQLMNISLIIKVDNFTQDFLTFFVCWYNPKGDIYYLYTFDDNQNIHNHYYCGDFVPFAHYKTLMEKLTDEIMDYGVVTIRDFNNDGFNEIALYSFYKYIGNVFCVYGFNNIENVLEELCLVPVFINYDNPFPSVEYIGNGFKILEVVDDEYTELAWNKYIWDIEKRKYAKQ
jgi:hypothetical protein